MEKIEPTNQRHRILETAEELIRRFGGAKTNVVDIAQAMGLSHSAIYRHFRSKAEIFDALAATTMQEESVLAETYVTAPSSAADRLSGLILALHQRKRDKFIEDPEMHALFRRIVEERPDMIAEYARQMTDHIRTILADGVQRGEFRIADIDAAAGAVRDAMTIFVHPAHIEMAMSAGRDQEKDLSAVIQIILAGLAAEGI